MDFMINSGHGLVQIFEPKVRYFNFRPAINNPRDTHCAKWSSIVNFWSVGDVVGFHTHPAPAEALFDPIEAHAWTRLSPWRVLGSATVSVTLSPIVAVAAGLLGAGR